jgi:hypothetical protein
MLYNRALRAFPPGLGGDVLLGGFHAGPMMFDSGCNSLLLFFKDADAFEAIFDLFPPESFLFTIGASRGVSGSSLTLKIRHPLDVAIPLTFPSFPAMPQIDVPYLRFHLCTEDVVSLQAKIAQSQALRVRIPAFINEKLIDAANPPVRIPRRNHALLGMTVLRDYCCTHKDGMLVVSKGFIDSAIMIRIKEIAEVFDLDPTLIDFEDDMFDLLDDSVRFNIDGRTSEFFNSD